MTASPRVALGLERVTARQGPMAGVGSSLGVRNKVFRPPSSAYARFTSY